MSALAQQQQMHFVPPQAQKQTTLFVGSISGGITDAFLNQLLTVSHFENSNIQHPDFPSARHAVRSSHLSA